MKLTELEFGSKRVKNEALTFLCSVLNPTYVLLPLGNVVAVARCSLRSWSTIHIYPAGLSHLNP